MPFDMESWHKHAIQSDVGGVAIYACTAIRSLSLAIRALRDGGDPEEHLRSAEETADDLNKVFRELTGYTPDAE